MKMLVTGGCGFVGSNLVKMLVDKGHDVAILDNLSTGRIANLSICNGAVVTIGDVCDADVVNRCAKDAEVIFHLAASVGNKQSIDHPTKDARVNVLGTLNVLEAARWFNVPKVVFSSSAGIFGELKELPISEDHPAEPDSPYGCSKLCAEKLCLVYGKIYDIETVCLRYFNVYGPRQRYNAYGNVIPIFARQLLRNEPLTIFGDGQQTRDFVSVHDVAQANYLAATTDGVTGAYNIGSGTATTINSLVEMMLPVPKLRALMVTNKPSRPGDVRDSVADISKAREAFGYDPAVSLWDGLVEYMNWARNEEIIK